MAQFVKFSAESSVGIVTLARPEAGNAINAAVAADLDAAVARVEQSGVRAVLLCAEGPNFSMGGDLRAFGDSGSAIADTLEGLAISVHATQLRLVNTGLPIVSAVRGVAVGGGLGLALMSDYLIASDTARLSTGYSRLGLSGDAGVTYFLSRALGPRRAATLLMDARFITAAEALAMGLVETATADDALDETALRLARQLAEGPTAAFAAIRRLTDAAGRQDLASHLDMETREIVALARDPRAEAHVAAVLAKKSPRFHD